MHKSSIYHAATYLTIVSISVILFNWQDLIANSTELANKSIVSKQIHYKNTIGQSNNNWLLEAISKLFAPSSRSGGSRGDDFVCAESPSFDSTVPYLWTRQPLLIWSGSASSLRVIDSQSKQIIWQKPVDSKLKFGKVRIEKSLITGRKYTWQVIFDPNSNSLNPSIDFQMVSNEQHQKIRLDLEKLEKQLYVKKSNPEEIIFTRAKYFANLKMWGDVQELLSMVPESSPQYKKAFEILGEMQKSLGLCLQTKL